MKKPTEKEFQKSLVHYLKMKGYLVFPQQSGMMTKRYKDKEYVIRMSAQGTPDILACDVDGKFVGIECKRGKKEADEWYRKCNDRKNAREFAQAQTLEGIVKNHGKAYLAWWDGQTVIEKIEIE